MATLSRLERLRKLVQADLDALPDRPVSPEPAPTAPAFSDDEEGGISLEGLSIDGQPNAPDSKPLPVDPPASTKAEHVLAPMKEQPSPDVPTPANAEMRSVWLPNAASAYNLRGMSESTTLPPPVPAAAPPCSAPLPDTDLQRGDLPLSTHNFAPITALAKYPYKYCNKTDSQAIATAFFDAGKFWTREWDLYYIRDSDSTNLVALVTERQFQQLLNEINKHLKLNLRITNAQRQEGLFTSFPDHSHCLPRYLGRSRSRNEYDDMMDNAPEKAFRAPGEPEVGPPSKGTMEEFKELLDKIQDAQRNKNKLRREKTHAERLGRQLSMLDQFKRAQRYLGLRPSESPASPDYIDPGFPPPFAFDQSVVFVSVDVESYERAHHKITEIGLATLDTRDLIGVPPGADGENWRKLLKARHFRINEHKHLINHEFVAGHPEGFDHGTSTFVSLKDAPAHVSACFRQPFGVHATNTPVETIKIMLDELDFDEKRSIILLGHDTHTDVRYLQQLGFDPLKLDNIIESLDTAKIYQAWRREQQSTSLGRVLASFDIAAWKLHNAGNDAVYTIWAMLATCVREATIRGTPELDAMRKDDKAAKEAAAHESTAQRLKEEHDGWSEIEQKSNGGDPVSLKSL